MMTALYVFAAIGGAVSILAGVAAVASFLSWVIGHVTDHWRLQRAFVDFMFDRAGGKKVFVKRTLVQRAVDLAMEESCHELADELQKALK